MRDLLVTGTDTGVGKTVVAAAIVETLRNRGVRAVGFKPAETGVERGMVSDSELLARASNERLSAAAPLVSLPEPLAPAVAAERAGISIDPAEIEARIEQLRRAGATVVVEGAGGVTVPLAWGYTALDLAQACNLDAVVVARAGLGTLNHIVMTVAMLRARDIPVRCVILNGRRTPSDLAEETNPLTLARLLPDVRVLEISHAPDDPIRQALAVTDTFF